ncbi:MAG TPA: glycosyltransferase family A protein [Mycobacteriales bacterium]|jgi:glycosyltransferase involved in cell wall biosynthesis|nr:glycosyltransferase family A protein [Mycobacteriales bacterium]
MSWVVVTPARNEADRIGRVAASLAAQTVDLVGLWVVVDDGSTDGTADAVPAGLPFPVEIVRRENSGGLSGGSAFRAFWAGAEAGLSRLPDAERVMKLDADAMLEPDYFSRLVEGCGDAALVAGRVDEPGNQSRPDYTRGVLKAYDRAAIELLRELPVALGYDVMDEVLLRLSGLDVRCVPDAVARVSRRTGSSEGDLDGRRRAGRVARWTGFHPLYFLARLGRYAVRHPYGIGSIVMLWAYLTAGPGPYAATLKAAHRAEQVSRMRSALRRSAGGRTLPSPPRSVPTRSG